MGVRRDLFARSSERRCEVDSVEYSMWTLSGALGQPAIHMPYNVCMLMQHKYAWCILTDRVGCAPARRHARVHDVRWIYV